MFAKEPSLQTSPFGWDAVWLSQMAQGLWSVENSNVLELRAVYRALRFFFHS